MPRKKNRKTTLRQYRFQAELTKVKRAAHFLHWASETMPKEWFWYDEILQAIMGYRTKPRRTSQDVEQLHKSMSRVREILFRDYDQDLLVRRGVGCRATIDDDDRVLGEITKRADNVVRADAKLRAVADRIRVSKLRDKRAKDYMRLRVMPILKECAIIDLKRLRSPADPQDSEK